MCSVNVSGILTLGSGQREGDEVGTRPPHQTDSGVEGTFDTSRLLCPLSVFNFAKSFPSGNCIFKLPLQSNTEVQCQGA